MPNASCLCQGPTPNAHASLTISLGSLQQPVVEPRLTSSHTRAPCSTATCTSALATATVPAAATTATNTATAPAQFADDFDNIQLRPHEGPSIEAMGEMMPVLIKLRKVAT